MVTNESQIPLFPLNVVLFPGMMLPLHIFEERYKLMVQECLAGDRLFGVILAKNKRAQAPHVVELNPDDIYTVGTTAHIRAVENLDDGRMNLITVGQDRFIVNSILPGKDDFLIGQVGPLVMPDNDQSRIESMAQKLRPLVKQYIEHLGNASGEDLSGTILPSDPEDLAFLAGAAMQGPLPDKQRLLASGSLIELVANATTILDREEQILSYMLKAYKAHQEVERLPFVDYSLN